ncbi:hypothetical protein NPIL_441581 [Nephila pilipes]|uniref:Uncharacterized protein n=1 Tax=Nephila pilipes TaxID=299642 RepID=A0A8X6N0H6_NEPPI|nr:hypothetical protein NPIL_441581 [Nephila pilipes]
MFERRSIGCLPVDLKAEIAIRPGHARKRGRDLLSPPESIPLDRAQVRDTSLLPSGYIRKGQQQKKKKVNSMWSVRSLQEGPFFVNIVDHVALVR